ncbi:MAG: regulatory protein GemA [Paracoccus sp. (in: a-proteobacteria)]|nr:regulatory protein GemA [Paracoccus sp. (in: a-proteobacteria)]
MRIDAETRHAMQQEVTGKSSMSDMTDRELRLVADALRARGFESKPHGTGRPPAARADVRYIHVLWGLLADAEVVDRPGADGLNAFIRARFSAGWGSAPIDVDALRDHKQINAVIKALQAMCDRHGIVCRQAKDS